MASFSDFPLAAPLHRALAVEGYTLPTPIQVQAIPHALAGRDILGIAQTGTGKTCAFALPILQRLCKSGTTSKPNTCRALILSPTRELASQIADSFRAYGKFMHLSIDVVFGGIPIARQIRRLENGIDILVATPGRLLDLVQQKALSLRDIEIFVLDEADQMLDLGFIVPLKRIQAMLPKQRQSMFFSATMPDTIAGLAANFLSDPVKVAVTPVASTAERVTQGVMFVPQPAKQELLYQVLSGEQKGRVLVFTRTKHGADKVVKHLIKDGIEAAAIHGNKSQNQRENALRAFRAGTCRVLVATDIAARGIDVDGVTHVINFELPNIPESYVHRIGRTARAGASGIALSFCAKDERPFLRDIERLTRLNVPVLPLPEGFSPSPADIREVEPASRPAQRPQRSSPARTASPAREARGPNGQGRFSEGRGQDARGQETRPYEARGQEARTQEARGQEARPGNRPNPRLGGRPDFAGDRAHTAQPKPAARPASSRPDAVRQDSSRQDASRPNPYRRSRRPNSGAKPSGVAG